MFPLLLATRNGHKTREFAALMGPEFLVDDLMGRSDLAEVEESGLTFEENAALKAVAASRLSAGYVLADDSGLEVESLGGAPGVYSARYAGAGVTDEQNVAKLLHQLEKTSHPNRAARFRCALALARGGEVQAIFHGTVAGRIATAPAGDGGFGYDPVFIPDGFDRTLAELGDAIKMQISHRAHAVAQLLAHFDQVQKGRR